MIVYSTGCPMCVKLLKRLDESNISYELCTDEGTMAEMGIEMVPMIDTGNGELLNFAQAIKFIKEMAE